MYNNQSFGNLIPNSERSREELQAMGRKGGIKSGETRRRQAAMRKRYVQMMLAQSFAQELAKDELKLFREWLRKRYGNGH